MTSPPLRELYARRGGIGVVCTEFVRVTSQPLSEKTLRRHVARAEGALLSVQVMGNDIEQMAEAASMAIAAGADIVDINLGCPAPKAVRKGVGSAMLKDLELMRRVVSRMRERTTTTLSAKIRAGFDDSSRVVEVASLLEEAGVDFLTVHPRRRVDFYEGVADWRIIRLLAQELRIPVIGNGDIWSAGDAIRIVEETGCEGVMLGRPALRNPWIFSQLASLTAGVEPVQPNGRDCVTHLRELEAALGPEVTQLGLLGLLKEQVRYLGRALFDGGAFLKSCLRCSTLDTFFEIVERELLPLDSAELDLAALGCRLERSGSATPAELPSGLSLPSGCLVG